MAARVARSVDAVECRMVADALDEFRATFLGFEGFGLGDQAVILVKFLPGDFVFGVLFRGGFHGGFPFLI